MQPELIGLPMLMLAYGLISSASTIHVLHLLVTARSLNSKFSIKVVIWQMFWKQMCKLLKDQIVRYWTPWLQDLLVNKSSQLPGEHIARPPFWRKWSHTCTQGFPVLSDIHLLLGRWTAGTDYMSCPRHGTASDSNLQNARLAVAHAITAPRCHHSTIYNVSKSENSLKDYRRSKNSLTRNRITQLPVKSK